MVRYTLTIFSSAFLLFLVQPLIARRILPEYGGTAAVWTTSLVYFQVVLLLGYLYAHLIRAWLRPRTGFALHALLLLAACIFVQFNQLKIESGSQGAPLAQMIAWQLTCTVGLPFLALAATGPLIQAWHSLTHPDHQTYRLYALSNAGSLLALIAYPFVFDRFLGLSRQSAIWSVGFLLFSALMFVSGWQLLAKKSWEPAGPDQRAAGQENRYPGLGEYVLWFLLSASACSLLVSTTNLLCQELAAFPFLWILPLVFYLLTLIICFDRPQWYQRNIFLPILAAVIGMAILLFHIGTNAGLLLHAATSAAVVFSGAMVCHGELARSRPATEHLTRFYLMVSFGGAVGGVFAAAIAPRIFTGFLEFHVSLLACLLVAVPVVIRDAVRSPAGSTTGVYWQLMVLLLAATPLICSLLFLLESAGDRQLLFRARNDYGIVSVKDSGNYRTMYNGRTNHGGQFLDGDTGRPSAYYSAGSGAETAFLAMRRWKSELDLEPALRVGVIGLGTGSLASYHSDDDRFRFYEINPLAVHAAKEFFTYLSQSKADVELGDGRILLEREALAGRHNDFDLLFIDAFSSDSIPVHLLTAECFDLYLQHLNPQGILVMHITNKFVDLRAVMKSVAEARNLSVAMIEHENPAFGIRTRWVLMSPTKAILSDPTVQDRQLPWPADLRPLLWTDENTSLASVVIWSGGLNLSSAGRQPEETRQPVTNVR